MIDLDGFCYSFNSNSALPPQNLPNTFENEKRNVAHHSARHALMECLGQKSYEYEQLKITNHHHLTNWPEKKVSLSHTAKFGAACISESVKSLGIDLEEKSREVKENVYKYFLNENDDKEIEPLHLWCLKEAAYKAISPYVDAEEKLVLSKIAIHSNQFHYKNYIGNYHLTEVELEDEPYLFAIAYLENE